MSPPHWWRVSAHHHPPRFDRQPLGTVPTLIGVRHPPELLAGLSCSSGLLVGRSSDENPGPSSSTSVSRFGDASSEPRDRTERHRVGRQSHPETSSREECRSPPHGSRRRTGAATALRSGHPVKAPERPATESLHWPQPTNKGDQP